MRVMLRTGGRCACWASAGAVERKENKASDKTVRMCAFIARKHSLTRVPADVVSASTRVRLRVGPRVRLRVGPGVRPRVRPRVGPKVRPRVGPKVRAGGLNGSQNQPPPLRRAGGA